MIKLYDSDITKILPEIFTSEEKVQALGYAISQAVQRLLGYCQNISVYAAVDFVPENVLDILAVELNTQYYDDTLDDIEIKRRLVKNTLIWYLSAGTPAAVEELIAAAFEEGKVIEWFDYDGKPYCFKVRTDALLQENTVEYFLSMIQKIKNVRSHLEAIEFQRVLEQPYYAGCAMRVFYKPAAIIDGYEITEQTCNTIYAGSRMIASCKPAAIIDGYKVSGNVRSVVYAGVGEVSQIYSAAVREAD